MNPKIAAEAESTARALANIATSDSPAKAFQADIRAAVAHLKAYSQLISDLRLGQPKGPFPITPDTRSMAGSDPRDFEEQRG